MDDAPLNLHTLRDSVNRIAQQIHKLDAPEDDCSADETARAPERSRPRYRGAEKTPQLARQLSSLEHRHGARDKLSGSGSNNESDGETHTSSVDSSESQFLEFQDHDLREVDDAFNIDVSRNQITNLFEKLHTDERVQVATNISDWFAAAADASKYVEEELVSKDRECAEAVERQDNTHAELRSQLESHDLHAIECMRRFHTRMQVLRPAPKSTSRQHLASDARGNHAHRYPVVGSHGHHRNVDNMGIHHAIHHVTEHIDAAKDGAEESTEVKTTVNTSVLASELLDVIARQQNEIAHLHTRSDINSKRTEAVKAALEWVRAEQDVAENGGRARAQKAMPFAAKELLDEMNERMKMKAMTELLASKDGRQFLSKCVQSHGGSAFLEAPMKTAELVEEYESLVQEKKRLNAQLIQVGYPRDREEALRRELENRKLALAQAAKDSNTKAFGAAPADDPQVPQAKAPRRVVQGDPNAEGNAAPHGPEPADRGGVTVHPVGAGASNKGGVLAQIGATKVVAKTPVMSEELVNALTTVCINVETQLEAVNKHKEKLFIGIEEANQKAADEAVKRDAEREARLDEQDERETQALRAQVAEEKKKLEELTEEETHLQNKQQQLQQKLTQIRAAIKEKEESRPAAGQAQPNNAPAQHVVTRASRHKNEKKGRRASLYGSSGSRASNVAEEEKVDATEVKKEITAVMAEVETLEVKNKDLAKQVERAERQLAVRQAQAQRAAKSGQDHSRGEDKPGDEAVSSKQRETVAGRGSPCSTAEQHTSPRSTVDSKSVDRPSVPARPLPADVQGSSSVPASCNVQAPSSADVPEHSTPSVPNASQGEPAAVAGSALSRERRTVAPQEAPTHGPGSATLIREDGIEAADGLGADADVAATRPSVAQPARASAVSGVSKEKRQEQIAELLNYQNENILLQKQIKAIDDRIREAKLHRRPGKGTEVGTELVPEPLAPEQPIPEENKAMRREVAKRQRELNALRKRWWAEKAKPGDASAESEGLMAGHVESAVMKLLKGFASKWDNEPPEQPEQPETEAEPEVKKQERNLYLLPVLPQGQAFPARRSSRRRSISDLTKSDKFLTRPNGRQKQPTPNEQFARVLQAMREPIGDATTGTSVSQDGAGPEVGIIGRGTFRPASTQSTFGSSTSNLTPASSRASGRQH